MGNKLINSVGCERTQHQRDTDEARAARSQPNNCMLVGIGSIAQEECELAGLAICHCGHASWSFWAQCCLLENCVILCHRRFCAAMHPWQCKDAGTASGTGEARFRNRKLVLYTTDRCFLEAATALWRALGVRWKNKRSFQTEVHRTTFFCRARDSIPTRARRSMIVQARSIVDTAPFDASAWSVDTLE